MKEYPETHQYGDISIENPLKNSSFKGDLGVQIAEDGRIWLYIDGAAFLRFKPAKKRFEVVEHYNGYSLSDLQTGGSAWLSDGVDVLNSPPGTEMFRIQWEATFNANIQETLAAYFQ